MKDKTPVDIMDSSATLHKFAYVVSRWLSPSPSLLCSEHVFNLGEGPCMHGFMRLLSGARTLYSTLYRQTTMVLVVF